MYSKLWILAAAVVAVTAASDETIGAWVDDNGVTHIYGNSFGRPGYNDSYDYIIIGGGNAGNTIAARLALDPANYSVAVVEAGSFYEILDGNRTQIPGYNYVNTITFPLGRQTSPTVWGLETVPQPGYADRSIYYLQGQTFGGGTAANYMGYQRGTIGTFNQWAEEVGDDFWSWDSVYPAFKKSVTFQPPDYTKIDPSVNISYDPSAFDRRSNGPLHVSYGNYQNPYGPSLGRAMDRSGLRAIRGFNSGRLIGHGTATATIDTRTATRDSSETSFLQEAARRSNIKIYPNAVVTRIIFDSEKRATGVEVQSNIATGTLKYTLSANKEVILSAGWFSPQILMLSGVGPAETLRQHGIEVVADLPGVGQNEHEQPVVGMLLALNVPTMSQFQNGNETVIAAAIDKYINDQSGPLSGFGTGQGIAFEKFPQRLRRNFSRTTLDYLSTYPRDWPEVEYLPLDSAPVIPGITENYNLLTWSAVLLSTKSRGNMTISSPSIFDPPVISPNWFQDEGDIQQAYAAFLRLREIISHWDRSVFAGEIFPTAANVSSYEEFVPYLATEGSMIFHGTSTCRMGPPTDPTAVVDSRARVYGVTGLRVVDTSAFRNCPPGHPMSAAYMFAEKIAESILDGN
ncbi:hypothetical protein BJX63DRAFT_61587 [Aspergillus granulosus]|uniref:GMC oxidoreductase n=1 Tax=Aspergillus granulosus TaxID=176169 RepID=A0ABR4GWY5_9EURO